jgi:hypothetical protein
MMTGCAPQRWLLLKKIRNEYNIELNDNKKSLKGRTIRIESVQSYTNSQLTSIITEQYKKPASIDKS